MLGSRRGRWDRRTSQCGSPERAERRRCLVKCKMTWKVLKSPRTGWSICIGKVHVTIESDTNLALLLSFELLAVNLHSVSVRDDQVVGDDERFRAAVTTGAEKRMYSVGVDWVGRLYAVGRATRGELATSITEDSDAPRFVEGEPVRDAISKSLEAELRRVSVKILVLFWEASYLGVICKVRHDLLFVQPATITVVKSLW